MLCLDPAVSLFWECFIKSHFSQGFSSFKSSSLHDSLPLKHFQHFLGVDGGGCCFIFFNSLKFIFNWQVVTVLISGVQGSSWTYACIIDFAGYSILNLHITVTFICNIIEAWYTPIQKVSWRRSWDLNLLTADFFLHGSKMSEKYLVFFWANRNLVTPINST